MACVGGFGLVRQFPCAPAKQLVLSSLRSSLRHCSSRTAHILHAPPVAMERLEDCRNAVAQDINRLHGSIRDEISSKLSNLSEVSQYYFDGNGKHLRPMIVFLMARACNQHSLGKSVLLDHQYTVGLVSEMIHTASLVHDDVIDNAECRRGKPAINKQWGEKMTILAGDYILARCTLALARTRHPEVVELLSRIIEDLVHGEFMQLGNREENTDRFAHYLEKSFRKTASLLAHCCQAVALLSTHAVEIQQAAYSFGRHTGLAFQIIDDVLDFISTTDTLGKPAANDLRQGLATAPVLYAAEEYPELNDLIIRRFSISGDVERAQEYIAKSRGIERSRELAQQHCEQALTALRHLDASDERHVLQHITEDILHRIK
ncbi:all trans-polyprenyl-diphosphate synthase PDSS1-like [Sycon ciliatum]|uniref:all trans-polyprenyl-diphosphate synthase PDSS1-like n=1 Tax=Sycon ciliatum TaxID=27933 RepID=UPI0020AEC734|eukprot:scpid31424/ scgid12933/ Decaprenyl-diphosphate synthase subunit 1; All-trans-decaprenyl-diphosphate synthase subunit 1; Decaprenyl pyrophosphate synthase subunit 1; Solanesyl-diphosphate synthase subunit 1; Trans-prenyltransferase 1